MVLGLHEPPLAYKRLRQHGQGRLRRVLAVGAGGEDGTVLDPIGRERLPCRGQKCVAISRSPRIERHPHRHE